MLARLRTLIMDRPSQDEPLGDERDAILREWEQVREQATSAAELAEIDAIFGRHAA